MSLDVMKQALEALEEIADEVFSPYDNKLGDAILALRAAIEQALEPVAWMNPSWIDPDTRGWASDSFESIQIEGWIPLYTAPRQWQGLMDEERGQVINANFSTGLWQMAKDIEAKLKEKNT